MRAVEQHRVNAEALKVRNSEKQLFKQRQSGVKAEMQKQDEAMSEMQKKSNQKGVDNGGHEDQAKQAKAKLATLLEKFSKGSIDKLSSYFEKEQNPSLCSGIECFVALLRGTRKASNVDVELYLKDYDKLMWKLKRAEVSHLDLVLIEYHKAQLGQIKNGFSGSHPDAGVSGEWTYIIDWAEQFCVYAEHHLVAESEKSGCNLIQ